MNRISQSVVTWPYLYAQCNSNALLKHKCTESRHNLKDLHCEWRTNALWLLYSLTEHLSSVNVSVYFWRSKGKVELINCIQFEHDEWIPITYNTQKPTYKMAYIHFNNIEYDHIHGSNHVFYKLRFTISCDDIANFVMPNESKCSPNTWSNQINSFMRIGFSRLRTAICAIHCNWNQHKCGMTQYSTWILVFHKPFLNRCALISCLRAIHRGNQSSLPHKMCTINIGIDRRA